MSETDESRLARLEQDAVAIQDLISELLLRARVNDRRLDRFELRLDHVADVLSGIDGALAVMSNRLDDIAIDIGAILRRLPEERM